VIPPVLIISLAYPVVYVLCEIDQLHIPRLVSWGGLNPNPLFKSPAKSIFFRPYCTDGGGNTPRHRTRFDQAECAQSEGRATMQFGSNFADMGKVWTGEQAKFNETDSILSSVGVRLYSSRSSHKSFIYMDIAKPFVTSENVDAWEWRLQIKQSF
jgi:hypothetical protein